MFNRMEKLKTASLRTRKNIKEMELRTDRITRKGNKLRKGEFQRVWFSVRGGSYL
jgi:hypothetical protein